MSARAELARRALETLAQGHLVSTHDALQLRNWAVRPEDSVLTLAEIAHRILGQDEDPKAIAGDFPESLEESNRIGVAFLITELDLAMTFLDTAAASRVAESKERNLENAREAYAAVLRFRPRFTETDAQRAEIDTGLAAIKTRLKEFWPRAL